MKSWKPLGLLPFILAGCHESNTYQITPEEAAKLGGLQSKEAASEIPPAQNYLADSVVSLNTDGSVKDAQLNLGEDKVQVYNASSEAQDIYVNGSEPSFYEASMVGKLGADVSQLGTIYGSYVTEESHVSYTSLINRLDANDLTLVAHEGILQDLDWTGTGIDYGYVTSDGTQPPVQNSGGDGTITLGTNGNWSANLGDVNLTGKLDGTNVTGTSQLGEMTGTFVGVDGVIFNNAQVNQITGGAFNGSDGEQASFAGGWFAQK